MNTILTWLIGAGVVLGALFAAEQYIEHRGYTRAKVEDALEIEKQEREAGLLLQAEKDKARAATEAFKVFKGKQELLDVENQKNVAFLSNRLLELGGDDGRLRDPNADSSGESRCGAETSGTGCTPISTNNAPEARGLLSKQLSGVLQQLTLEADSINNAYRSCIEDAKAVRATCTAPALLE